MLTFYKLFISFVIGLIVTSILTSIAIIPTQCELEKRGLPMNTMLSADIAYMKLTSSFAASVLIVACLVFTTALAYNSIYA